MKKLVNYDLVDMTEAEKKQMAEDVKAIAEVRKKRLEAIEKKKKDKESADKKLKDLGLTDDEILALRS